MLLLSACWFYIYLYEENVSTPYTMQIVAQEQRLFVVIVVTVVSGVMVVVEMSMFA